MKNLILIFIFLLPMTPLSFAQENNDGKVLFESKCNKCHPLSRPLGKTKDLQGWRSTTKRMSGKKGSGITLDEAEIIAGYLASRK